MCIKWFPAATAPKDGTVILGFFGDLFPFPQVCCWNEPTGEWCVSVLQADMYHGEWDDFYFQNEYSAELLSWQPLPGPPPPDKG